MAKRYEPLKEFGRTTKKPKLEFVINKGRTETKASLNAGIINRPGSSAQLRFSGKSKSPPKSSPDNFWNDDDDEVILLASQVAESLAASAIPASENTEITFSEFVPGQKSSTSTQKPDVPSEIDVISKMLDEDDDWPMLDTQNANAFKVPLQPQLASAKLNKTSPPPKTSPQVLTQAHDMKASASSQSQYNARRKEKAFECQIQFLMKRLDKLKDENTKLSKNLEDSKTKMMIKDGETSVLRDEIRHLKQQIQSIRMDKIHSSEAAKIECKTKIAELSKQVEAKQTALELKSVEFSKMKMRFADESMRLETSIRENHSEIHQPFKQSDRLFQPVSLPRKSSKRSLMRLDTLPLRDPVPLHHETIGIANIPKEVFEQSNERGTSKTRKILFQLELENLQIILAQLHSCRNRTFSPAEVIAIIKKTIGSARKVIPEFWTYVHSLEFAKDCRSHPYHEYDLTKDSSDVLRQSLFQPSEMYDDEKAVNLRRYITSLSLICRNLPEVPRALFSEQHDEYLLIQIVIDALNKLGYSREICQHFGVLEAFAFLLHSLLLQNMLHEAKHHEQLVGLLKTLVFCRPSPWVFRDISRCFLVCATSRSVLSRLCANSAAKHFIVDPFESLYKFSPDSCIIQVYCGLLEISFPLHEQLSSKQFHLLSVICCNHVRFVSFCFVHPPKFVQDMLPSDEDDDEDANVPMHQTKDCTNSTSTATNNNSPNPHDDITCECYTKLCTSVVTLLYQVLRNWLRKDRMLETSKIEQISKIAVKLLHTIFCQHNMTRVFRIGGDTTKHYLYLICKCWSDYATELNFNEIHNTFLQKLLNSCIMPTRLSDLGNKSFVRSDLSQWYLSSADNSDQAKEPEDGEKVARELRLLEKASDPEMFFEGLKGYSFNFE